MTTNRFEQLLLEREWLLADGATGTNYFTLGLQSGDAPELWNTDHPDRVTLLHQQFIDAGADILLTNSFGGSAYRLKLHQSEHRVPELNAAAARIARVAAEAAERPVAVAGSMGPTGELMVPHGTLTKDAANEVFTQQAHANRRAVGLGDFFLQKSRYPKAAEQRSHGRSRPDAAQKLVVFLGKHVRS